MNDEPHLRQFDINRTGMVRLNRSDRSNDPWNQFAIGTIANGDQEEATRSRAEHVASNEIRILGDDPTFMTIRQLRNLRIASAVSFGKIARMKG